MITSSPSPTLRSGAHSSPSSTFASRSHYDGGYRPTIIQASSARPRWPHAPPSAASTSFSPHLGARLSSTGIHKRFGDKEESENSIRGMVDASTQYSPPAKSGLPGETTETPVSKVEGLQLGSTGHYHTAAKGQAGNFHAQGPTSHPQMASPENRTANEGVVAAGAKRSTSDLSNNMVTESQHDDTEKTEIEGSPSSKRPRPAAPPVRLMPMQYETCDPRDLVVLISSMLMELVRYNDAIPLRDGHLTRFHSRAPPGISVLDYLQRLTTHATLSPPILLSMVYYIDKLCALYPAFTISSLTVHRFLITSATVASKGLSDSFWTNKTYARVGGVSLKELALLELEFLWRVEWRIVPKPEVLVDYYRSLVERSDGYEIDITGKLEEDAEGKGHTDKG